MNAVRKRPYGCLLLLVLVLFGTGSCHQPPQSLRVGLLVWPPYELAMLAREKGWLDRENIRLIEYQSPSELTRAFRNELLDVVFITSHISLRLAANGTDHRTLFVIDFSRGGDALVARQSISRLQDLKGRSIGVEPSALGAYVFHRMLDFADLKPSEVNVVPLDVAEQATAWEMETVDAVICYEPVRTNLIKQGGHVLFDSRTIPDEIADVIIAHTSVVNEKERFLQALISNMVRALRFYQERPQDAIEIMARRTALSREEFSLALAGAYLVPADENRRLLRGERPQLHAALEKQLAVMHRSGILDRRVDIASLVDGRFVCRDCLE